MSQSELARRAKLSSSYINRLVRGDRVGYREDTLARIAQALGTTSTQMLVEAGLLKKPAEPPCTVPRAVLTDRDLTNAQKSQLLSLYDLFVGSVTAVEAGALRSS